MELQGLGIFVIILSVVVLCQTFIIGCIWMKLKEVIHAYNMLRSDCFGIDAELGKVKSDVRLCSNYIRRYSEEYPLKSK